MASPTAVSAHRSPAPLLVRYQSKAKADADEVLALVDAITRRVGAPSVEPEYVRHVARNAQFLQVLRVRSLEQEHGKDTARADLLGAFAFLCASGMASIMIC